MHIHVHTAAEDLTEEGKVCAHEGTAPSPPNPGTAISRAQLSPTPGAAAGGHPPGTFWFQFRASCIFTACTSLLASQNTECSLAAGVSFLTVL